MPLSAGLFHCRGADQKYNWVLAKLIPGAQRCVVFFPGDISDFADCAQPYSYSLEALLWALCCKFPQDSIVLVKPRILKDHFAIYVNFMLVDGCGNPRPFSERRVGGDEVGQAEAELEHPRAVEHLRLLLDSLALETGEQLPQRLVLAGFSKGAAVLNSLMREPEAEWWSRVESVHFLDAGLTVPGVFPLSEADLQRLRDAAAENIRIWLHCSPRQIQDASRPFVAEEHDAFERRCQAVGLSVDRRVYAEGRPVSLNMHFDVVRCFFTKNGDSDAGDVHCGFFDAWAATAMAS